MTRSSTGKNLSKTSPSRLGTYLATAVGSCGLATSADGAIVNIDLTNVGEQDNDITGTNGGVAAGNRLIIANWAGAGTGTLLVYNTGYTGLGGTGNPQAPGLQFAVSGSGYASPFKFGLGTTIDSSASFTSDLQRTVFSYSGDSPEFGANSFMGFRFGNSTTWNYGWIEATWNSSTNTFQLLSAAYESTPNTATAAGAAAPVPEPSAGALAALVLGGTALGIARRKRQKAAAATTQQAV